jgi:hypothetical protein
MKTKATTTGSAYYAIRKAINERTKSIRWVLAGAILAAITFLLVFLFYFSTLGILAALVRAFAYAYVACFSVIAIFVLNPWNNINNEDERITIGLEYLQTHVGTNTVALDLIEKRAEIGAAASQNTTLLPLLSLPILIPILIEFGSQIPFLTDIFLIIITSFALVFLIDVDRADTDNIIRHAVAEYRSQLPALQKQQTSDTKQIESPLLLEHLLSEDVKGKHEA